jgi:multisubunit Na+/H+ antiporter MnhC subunit
MDKEERKFQKEMAKLQADIQIWLTAAFGFIALMGVFAVATWQLYFSTPSDPLLRNPLVYVLVLVAVSCGVFAVISAKMMQSARDAIDKT